MRCLVSFALLGAAAPVALALDEGVLVQAAAVSRFDHDANFDLDMKFDHDLNVFDMDGGLLNPSQYGEAMMLTVRPIFGPDLPVRFRSGLPLQVLIHSICNKLQFDIASANFTKGGRQLDPMSTASLFGLHGGDVIELTSPALIQKQAEEEMMAAREERRDEILHQMKEEEQQRDAIRFERRRRVAMRVARRQEEERRKHDRELKDEITLTFTSPVVGGADVRIGVKRANWLEGYLGLVANRMGINRTKAVFLFRDDEDALSAIEPQDSVQTLGLRDEEVIAVKVPKEHPKSAAADKKSAAAADKTSAAAADKKSAAAADKTSAAAADKKSAAAADKTSAVADKKTTVAAVQHKH